MIKQQLINKSYKPLVEEIERYFFESDVVLQDDRNIIKEVEFNDKVLVVKSYKVPNFINSLVYTYLRKSKAWKAYEYGLKISKFTPKVIARIERFQPLLAKSYLICEKFEADFNMQAPLFKSHPEKDIIFEQFAKFVFELHQNKILHRDLSPGNILIKKSNEEYEFQIIDINRMSFKNLSKEQRAENFDKLWAHDEDLASILRAYAKLAQFDEEIFVQLGVKCNQKNKSRKTRKRKIKQTLGLW